MIYCDWAATAIFDREILEKALNTSIEFNGNPSSVHQFGINAKGQLLQARKRAAASLGVKEDCIIFTSGGTESNHLAITNLLQKPSKGNIVISNIEHPAISEMAENMKKCGWSISYAQADSRGIVSPESVIKALKDDTDLVCVMAVNNETGAIQPVYEIADALTEHCKGKKKPKFHVDCVQAAGKIPLDLSHKGIDSASLSAHKIGGPRGIGILYLKDSHIDSWLKGGGQEKGIRSGTENLFGSEAFSLALEKYFILDEKSQAYRRFLEQKEMTKNFIDELRKIPGASLIPESRTSDDLNYSPWVIQAGFKGIPGEVMVRALSAKEIYISTGSACSSRKMKRPILEAMKISKDLAETGVRFSFGHATSKEEMNLLLQAIKEVVSRF